MSCTIFVFFNFKLQTLNLFKAHHKAIVPQKLIKPPIKEFQIVGRSSDLTDDNGVCFNDVRAVLPEIVRNRQTECFML